MDHRLMHHHNGRRRRTAIGQEEMADDLDRGLGFVYSRDHRPRGAMEAHSAEDDAGRYAVKSMR